MQNSINHDLLCVVIFFQLGGQSSGLLLKIAALERHHHLLQERYERVFTTHRCPLFEEIAVGLQGMAGLGFKILSRIRMSVGLAGWPPRSSDRGSDRPRLPPPSVPV